MGPPPSTGAAATSNTDIQQKKRNLPTHLQLFIDYYEVWFSQTHPPSDPPPVGKAGFEAWVLTKGGLVSVHHCRLYRTVVHAHLVRVTSLRP